MNNKTLAIISYVTIIGCLISYFSIKKRRFKKSFVIYHLKQGLGLAIFHIALIVVIIVFASIVPSVAFILSFVQLVPFVLWVMGIMNAVNEKQVPLPLIGEMFQNKFTCIG